MTKQNGAMIFTRVTLGALVLLASCMTVESFVSSHAKHSTGIETIRKARSP